MIVKGIYSVWVKLQY